MGVLAGAGGLAAVVAGVVALAEGRAPFADPTALAFSVAAGVFEGGYFITLVMALSRAPLGLAYTLSRGGAILLVWPLSAWWLQEPVGFLAVIGSAVLAAGLLLAGMERGG